MKINLTQVGLLAGMGAIVMLFWSKFNEELVVESTPVSYLEFDEKIAKTPYKTATFGIG